MKNRKAKAQKYEYRCGDTAEELEWKAVSFAGSYASGKVRRKSL